MPSWAEAQHRDVNGPLASTDLLSAAFGGRTVHFERRRKSSTFWGPSVRLRNMLYPGFMSRLTGPSNREVTVQYEVVHDTVAVVRMNRPEYRNAQNSAMTYALDDALYHAGNDDAVKVVVLAGNGEHFSAGHDIGTPQRDSDQPFDRRASLWWDHSAKRGAESRYARESEVYLGMCRRWRELPKPTIAMVHGACIAGGLMLAWSCDLVVASDDAFFADPTVRMGVPGVEYFAHPWQMSPRFAKEFLFLGERLGAQEAQQLGMINRVVPRAQLLPYVLDMATRISNMPSFGLALAKRAVNQCEDLMGMRDGMDSVFGLHHLAHAHNAEVGLGSLAGHDANSMRELSKNQQPSARQV